MVSASEKVLAGARRAGHLVLPVGRVQLDGVDAVFDARWASHRQAQQVGDALYA